jgi:hypothetical protein
MYARNGRIPFDSTPGGHRRFDVDEVRVALQGDAKATVVPSVRFRGTSCWLVDGLDLEAWAQRMAARHELPEMVRTLVAGSVRDLRRVDFRAGEGAGKRGWDGVVDAVRGNAWVPGGCSAWEMGVNEDVTSKADEDYAARTNDPLGLVPSETVFVFATPRRWSQRDSWASTKRAEGVWKDVRAYDADSLEQWLDETPAVHVRVTHMLGRDPDGAADLVSAWSTWSTFTAPPLPTVLMTAGRDEQVRAVLAWLHGEPSELFVVGESAEEAFAFIAACLLELPEPERTALTVRTLVVRTAAAWDELLARAGVGNSLVLIPTFPQPQPLEAVDAGHHVALPVDGNAARTRPDATITLARLRRGPAQEALAATGLPEPDARKLALLARRSLLTLRRRLAVGLGARPAWARPEQGGKVAPLALAGAWRDDLDGDKRMLSALTGQPFDEVEALCTRWAAEADTPVRREGNVWFCVSKQDAWDLLRHLATRQTLQRFQETAVEVLTAVDPAMELESGRRWAAGAFGYVAPFSPQLRSSLADTVAMIAAHSGNEQLPVGCTGQEFADAIVRSILAAANEERSGQLWSSLSDVLPLLAEASPEQFLGAIDTGMEDDGSLLAVFDPRVEDTPFGSPAHTGLVWALERLAWSVDHLGAAALALARLAQRDPAGRRGGRPADSLNQIFLPWHPQTTADAEQRLGVIDMLRKRAAPDIAWSIMTGLLPTPHSIGQPTNQPQWREWPDTQQDQGGMAQWLLQSGPLVERLLQDAGLDGTRWATLISGVPSLPETLGDAVLGQLAGLDPARIEDEDRTAILHALREVVRAHRRFKDAPWAMPAERVDRIDEHLRRLGTDGAADTAWLFAAHVELPDIQSADYTAEDYAAEQQVVAERQKRAAQDTLAGGGIDAIWALSTRCEVSFRLGQALGRVGADDVDDEIIAELAAADRSRSQLADGYVQARFESGGRQWADAFLDQAETWPADRTAAFLRQLAADADTFDRADRFGPEVHNLYWGTVPVFLIQPADRVRAVRTLLETGHPNAALDLLSLDIHKSQQVDPELVMQALSDATAENIGNITMFVYHVTKLLEFLRTQSQIDRPRLARLEWRYLQLLEPHERPTRVLHEELARDPRFFADAIEAIFPGQQDDEDQQPTEEQRRLATQAYRLLKSWRTPPGSDNSAGPSLEDWVRDARAELTRRGLLRAGDQFIGQSLGRTAEDPDGAWPGERVREIIEDARSSDLEDGIALAVLNSERPNWRSLDTGGQPERARANAYQTYATRVGTSWPRTRRMLARIAEAWDRRARQEDHLAETRENFWA